MYYILSFSTVFVNIAISFLHFFLKKQIHNSLIFDILQNTTNLINLLITPIVLVVINIYYLKNATTKWIIVIITILSTIILNSLISYLGWGLRTSKMFTPDAETVMVSIYVNTLLPLIVSFLGLGICKLIKH